MRWFCWLVAVVLVGACGGNDAGESGTRAIEIAAERVELPAPVAVGDRTLEEVMGSRRSVRNFTARALTIEEMSQLMWALQGITSASGKRTAPSAGALYPLEVYVATGERHSRYLPEEHALVVRGDGDLRKRLAEAAVGQEVVGEAAVVVIITAVYARTAQKYGDRAERYATLEAGHAAQNLLLQAEALGLAAIPIGAFVDGDVQTVLDLPNDHEPLYLIAVGVPQ